MANNDNDYSHNSSSFSSLLQPFSSIKLDYIKVNKM